VALIRRGKVWGARLNPNQGAEVGKVRPVVVIQANPLTKAGPRPTSARLLRHG
jgi:mRNA interferase MazF